MVPCVPIFHAPDQGPIVWFSMPLQECRWHREVPSNLRQGRPLRSRRRAMWELHREFYPAVCVFFAAVNDFYMDLYNIVV